MSEFFNFKEKWMGEIDTRKRRLLSLATVTAILVALYLAALTLNAFKQYGYIGTGVPATNTISVSGLGEVFAVPDIAEISFSARAEGKTVAAAQKQVTETMNAALDFVKKSGVDEKDIKTTSYSAYPKYSYESGGVEPMIYPPRPGKQVLVGYEVAHTVMVKVRDTEKVGAILEGLGGLKVADISGPNFSIDDEDALKAEARGKAIADAKSKADELARELGVQLVRVVGFSESGGGYPVPIYAKAMGLSAAESATPDIPKGENKITSNVTITYEIR